MTHRPGPPELQARLLRPPLPVCVGLHPVTRSPHQPALLRPGPWTCCADRGPAGVSPPRFLGGVPATGVGGQKTLGVRSTGERSEEGTGVISMAAGTPARQPADVGAPGSAMNPTVRPPRSASRL